MSAANTLFHYVNLFISKKITLFSGCDTEGGINSLQPLMPSCALLCRYYKEYMEMEKEMCCQMFDPLNSYG